MKGKNDEEVPEIEVENSGFVGKDIEDLEPNDKVYMIPDELIKLWEQEYGRDIGEGDDTKDAVLEYAAHLILHDQRPQKDVADEYGIHWQTISKHYEDVAVEMDEFFHGRIEEGSGE